MDRSEYVVNVTRLHSTIEWTWSCNWTKCNKGRWNWGDFDLMFIWNSFYCYWEWTL